MELRASLACKNGRMTRSPSFFITRKLHLISLADSGVDRQIPTSMAAATALTKHDGINFIQPFYLLSFFFAKSP